MIKFDISQRVCKDVTNIDPIIYTTGLLDVVEYLLEELKALLIDESRYFGIVRSYANNIENAYLIIHSRENKEDLEIYGRILYLLKPSLRSEFERLCSRKLSPADSAICIIRKIMSILDEFSDYTYKKELITIKKIIDKMYDNIRNRSKKDSMFYFADHIRTCIENSLIGKYTLNIFSFRDNNLAKELLLEEEKKISLFSNTNQIFEKKLI